MKTDYTIADYEALNFLINHIDNIEESYIYCFNSLIQRNKNLKARLLTLLKETQKQIK
nr:MAG TPA: protein of unknown function (UPF0184) [Crassvirales sp.]